MNDTISPDRISNASSHEVQTADPEDRQVSQPNAHDGASVPWQTGWNFWITLITLFLALLLSSLETTIVATALVAISSDLGNFDKASWIPISYLMCYSAFLVIAASLSDIFGRRRALMVSVLWFTAFSGACGGSTAMTELLIFRAFQGVGGGSMYACVMATCREISPPGKLGLLMGTMGGVFALSSTMGPVIGGLIVQTGNWRWIFLLNIPGGVLILALLFWKFPNDIAKPQSYTSLLRRIDYPGAILSLAGCTCFIYALEAGSLRFEWRHVSIIATLTFGILFWCLFCCWEAWLGRRLEKREEPDPKAMQPIFPTRLISHRVIGFAMLSVFLSGFAFFVSIVNIPQRFQIEDDLSAAAAGVRLIPMLVSSAFGAGFAGLLLTKMPTMGFWMLLFSSGVQVLSLGLLSTVTYSAHVQAKEYVFEVLLGLGLGLYNSIIMGVGKSEVKGEDLAIAMSTITQVRTLGGIIGLAISQVVLFRHLLSSLQQGGNASGTTLTQSQLESFLDSATSSTTLQTLSEESLHTVKLAYVTGFIKQMRTTMYFAVASFVVLLFMWRREGFVFEDVAPEAPADMELQQQDRQHDQQEDQSK